MRYLDEAKQLLKDDVRCAVLCGENTFLSKDKGIAPILGLVGHDEYNGCVAADKIVGRAAAFIYAKIGAKEIYAEVLSRAALPVLERFGIKYTFGVLADNIRNRQKNGICPMEQTVKDIEDPDEAIRALAAKLEELRRGRE